MLPFTQDQFLAVFAAYNATVWPAPVAAYVLGAAAVYLALRPNRGSGRVVSLILAVLWAWTGVAYHWIHFRPINPAATIFAGAFVAQAILLAAFGGMLDRISFVGTDPVRRWAGLGLVAYSMVLYPLLGAAAGHVYPAAPVFGITPCPLTIFTFGMLLLSAPVPWFLVVIPLLWAVVGGSAAVLLGVPEDWMLPVSGVLMLVSLLRARNSKKKALAEARAQV